MATDSVTVSPTINGDSVSLTAGMIVRLKPSVNNNVVRAQASSAESVQGTIGIVVSGSVAPGTSVVVTTAGRQDVLLESGLSPAAGQIVYVSASIAGRGTNVAPSNAFQIGVIADVSVYSRTGAVAVDVSVAGAQAVVPSGTALWPQNNPRIYAVGGAHGDDSNNGFADAASSSTADVKAATEAAGLVAKKTLAGLAAVFPRQGNGRACAIVIANGTYADSLLDVLDGCDGYRILVVRGTGTNATAGCTAFDGSAADLLYVGGQTAVGVNTSGYNPTGGATTSVIPCQLNGGGSATFAAEPAVPLGCRIRFDGNTTTVALRNIAAAIVQVSGSTLTISHATVLPAVPATNDVFYIEQPGVVCPGTTHGALALSGSGDHDVISTCIVGVWVNSGLICPTGNVFLAFFQGPSVAMGSGIPVSIDTSAHLGGEYIWVDSTSFPRVGGAGRFDGFISADFSANTLNLSSFVLAATNDLVLDMIDAQIAVLGDGCVISPALLFGGNKPNISFGGIALGALTDFGEAPLRILGGGIAPVITLHNFSGTVGGMVVTGAGTFAALKLRFQSRVVFNNVVSGSTGNTDVGMDLINAFGSTIIFGPGALPTVTGTAGDVRLADGTIISWATAAAGVIDSAGNMLFSSTTSPLHRTPVTPGSVTVAITNAPAGSGSAPARYFKVPDGAGGFYTIASLT